MERERRGWRGAGRGRQDGIREEKWVQTETEKGRR